MASGGAALAGCLSNRNDSGLNESATTPTPAEIPSFHATNAGILSNIKTLELAVHEATNEFRAEEGYGPFRYNEDLAEIARNHSRNMAKEGFFSHDDHQGRTPGERVDYFGYPDAHITENLSRISGVPSDMNSAIDIAGAIVSGWKDSPPHRTALLETTKIVAGVGGYVTGKRVVFITAIYADVDGEIQ
jgi:uncharacterized protein YkwD